MKTDDRINFVTAFDIREARNYANQIDMNPAGVERLARLFARADYRDAAGLEYDPQRLGRQVNALRRRVGSASSPFEPVLTTPDGRRRAGR